MRIKKEMLGFIKDYVRNEFPGAKLYVFGSRTDDSKKGGDIDLLILTKQRLHFKEKSRMRINIWKKFGEQKIDILNYTFEEESTFKEIIFNNSIEI
mgnify:CR=1 FL=1